MISLQSILIDDGDSVIQPDDISFHNLFHELIQLNKEEDSE